MFDWLLNVVFLGFLVVLPGTIHGQSNSYVFSHLTVEDGLPQTNLRDVFKDSRGFYWFCSNGGISRYDGVEMLSNEEIAPGFRNNGAVDQVIEYRNSLYFSGFGYLIEYSYSENRFFEYAVPNVPDYAGTVYTLGQLVAVGDYLMSTNRYIFIFNTKTKKFKAHVLPQRESDTLRFDLEKNPELRELSKHLVFFNADDQEKLNVVSAKTGVRCLNWTFLNTGLSYLNLALNFVDFQNDSKLSFVAKHRVGDNKCYFFLVDIHRQKILKKNVLPTGTTSLISHGANHFLLSNNGAVQILDAASHRWLGSFSSLKNEPSSLMSNNVTRLHFIDGKMLVTQFDKGLSIAEIDNKLFTPYFGSEEANAHHTTAFIRDIVQDSRGHYWCIVNPSDVIELDEQFKFIRKLDLPPLDLAALYIDKDILYFGYQGLYTYNIKLDKLRKITSYFNQKQKIDLEGGDGEFQYFYKSRKEDAILYCVSLNRIIALNTETMAISEPSWNKGGYSTFAFEDVKGNVISGFEMINVRYIDKAGKELYAFQDKFEVRHVYEQDSSHLWLGTTNGLILFNTQKLQIERQWKKKDGLADNTIYAIVPDTFGRLWLSSNQGLSTLDLTDYSIVNYFDEAGQQSREYNRHAYWINKDHSILFPGINGITLVKPWMTKEKEVRPKVILTKVQSDSIHNPYAITSKHHPLLLSAGDNALELRIVASDLLHSKRYKIYYFLEGADHKWQVANNPAEIKYSALAPGSYRLHYKCLDPTNRVFSEEEIYFITLQPFFYETFLFKVFACLGLVTLFFLGFYMYARRKIRKQKAALEKQLAISEERRRIVSDLHDDVGATLSGLKIYSELAENFVDTDPAQSKRLIVKVSQNANEVIRNLSDIVWSLKSIEYEAGSLKARIIQMAQEFLQPGNIYFDHKIDDNIDQYFEEPGRRKNLILIVKESFNNIIKYANASKVNIVLQKNGSKLELQIEDNGTGFDENSIKAGNGLGNIKLRAASMGGQATIQSMAGKGSQIIVELPID